MGVNGLWHLLQPAGRPFRLEDLSDKVVAVDISSWLYQYIKALRDEEGDLVKNAHLLGLFKRLCVLLYHRIKPIIVFDGPAPALKKRILNKRREFRDRSQENLRKTAEQLFKNQMRTLALSTLAGKEVDVSTLYAKAKDTDDDIFHLRPTTEDQKDNDDEWVLERKPAKVIDEVVVADDFSDRSKFLSKFLEVDVTKIDIKSGAFMALPADIQHEILVEVQERQKRWTRFENVKAHVDMSKDSMDFSDMQIQRLLKKHDVSRQLEDVRARLQYIDEEGDFSTKRVAGDVDTQFVLQYFKEDSTEGFKSASETTRSTSEQKTKLATQVTLSPSPGAVTITIDAMDLDGHHTNDADDLFPASMFDVEHESNQPKALENTTQFIQDDPSIVNGKKEVEAISDADTELQLAIAMSLGQPPPLESQFGSGLPPLLTPGIHNELSQSLMEKLENPNTLKSTAHLRSLDCDDEREKLAVNIAITRSLEDQATNQQTNQQMNDVLSRNIASHHNEDIRAALALSVRTATVHTSESPLPDSLAPTTLLGKGKEKVEEPVMSMSLPKSPGHLIKEDACSSGVLRTLTDETTNVPKIPTYSPFTSTTAYTDRHTAAFTHSPFKTTSTNTIVLSGAQAHGNNTNTNSSSQSSNHASTNKRTSSPFAHAVAVSTTAVTPSPFARNVQNTHTLLNTTHTSMHPQQSSARIYTHDQATSQSTHTATGTIGVNVDVCVGSVVENEHDTVGVCVDTGANESDTGSDEDQFGYVLDGSVAAEDAELLNNEVGFFVDDDDKSRGSDTCGGVGTGQSVESVLKFSQDGNRTSTKYVHGPSYVLSDDDEGNVDERDAIGTDTVVVEMANESIVDGVGIEMNENVVNDREDARTDDQHDEEGESSLFADDSDEEAIDGIIGMMSLEEIEGIQNKLRHEREEIGVNQRVQRRDAEEVTMDMYTDSKELLKLFGVPWVDSPSEAEAQCAELDRLGLCAGSITEDSDIFLFGASTVYKHVFSKDHTPELYRTSDIERMLKLTRRNLVDIAMCSGSDYTEGIFGVGPVTSIEIISEFDDEIIVDDDTETDGEWRDLSEDRDPLVKFRNWYERNRLVAVDDDEAESTFRRKLRTAKRPLILPRDFPEPDVRRAYYNPSVDSSREAFEWSEPDLDRLREYASATFNWDCDTTDNMLLPVVRRLSEKTGRRSTQPTLHSFFAPQAPDPNRTIESKRVKAAVNLARQKQVMEATKKRGKTLESQRRKRKNLITKDTNRGKTKRRTMKETAPAFE
eukprot:CFRG6583T1